MALRAVTLATDGIRDYVVTPDGVRYVLGPVSVLKLVSKLVTSSGAVRRALDEFNRTGETMVSVDLERLFELLAPRRTRWAADSLIPSGKCEAPSSGEPPTIKSSTKMAADTTQQSIQSQIAAIERQIGVLNQKAKDAGGDSAAAMKADIGRLQDLVAWLRRPSSYGDQSSNATYYRLKPETPGGEKAACECMAQNDALANTILSQVKETDAAIERLATAGRRFNALKARQDLVGISTRVASVLQTGNMNDPAMTNALKELVAESSKMHGLFVGAK